MRFFKQLFKRRQLFSDICGYEDIKWTLQKAIENEDPVHILLVGPPGLGKTRFLSDRGRVPGFDIFRPC
jgi:holliday junction DNA helicase RuvB